MHKRLTFSIALMASLGGLLALSQGGSSAAEFTAQAEVHANAVSAISYPQLLSSLMRGENVAITVNFTECTIPATGAAGPKIVAGLHIDSFLSPQSPSPAIAFSDVHDTLNTKNQKVTEYIRYRVTPDNVVSISEVAMSAGGAVDSGAQYQCVIGKGAQFHWIEH
jgi:hypothetical protein